MMNTMPLLGLLLAWLALGVANAGFALASGRRERGWLAVFLTGGPFATSLLLVLTRDSLSGR
jgi:hypothetical protein